MTAKHHRDSRAVKICLALSLLVHFGVAAPLDFFKNFQRGTPVRQNQPIVVDLQEPAAQVTPPRELPTSPSADATPPVESALQAAEPQTLASVEKPMPEQPASESAPSPGQVPPSPPPNELSAGLAVLPSEGSNPAAGRAPLINARTEVALPPLRAAGEFLATDHELLSYRISMSGIPVGDAELEAKQEKGEVRIRLHIQSNPAISQLYPVDDSVETRHIGGNFILSRIRQHEGTFRSDKGFTLFLRDRSVFWIDRLQNRSIRESLPSSAVVDVLSGFYYLRQLPLEVGKPLVLQLFDGNRYAPATIAVLGKEHLTLPGLREVDALLIHAQLKTAGVFQRSGAISIWLTDDEKKVPVKVEVRIALGTLTAELVSAEVHMHRPAGADRTSTPLSDTSTPLRDRTSGNVTVPIGSADGL